MSRTERNFWLDVTIFMALLITTITGSILWLVIPHKLDIVFLGFPRSVWVAAHICFGVVGLAGIVIHIVRHWGWLKALRGRPLGGMPEKLRANRVVDRIIWSFKAVPHAGSRRERLGFLKSRGSNPM
jgi:hypothetical protein